MIRPGVAGAAGSNSKSGVTSSGNTTTSPNKQSAQGNHDQHSSSATIREIRSRTTAASTSTTTTTTSTASGHGSVRQQHLLATRRQAASMERLNNGSSGGNNAPSSSSASMNNLSDKQQDKCSPISGSNQSISGSTASSPSRGSSAANSQTGGLNRTASRVSRFRSAKAVFERLSSSNSAATSGGHGKPERSASSVTERPRGTVASRYAAAAVARNIAAQQAQQAQNALTASPRSRMNSKSPVRTSHQDLSKQQSPRHGEVSRQSPRPQPRVAPTSVAARRTTTSTNQNENSSPKTRSQSATSTTAKTSVTQAQQVQTPSQATATANIPTNKLPPRDLIDKIVLEIARDARKEHDADCTIQDLSNCDISGIPETLDFDKCFQDVEMMTEEEARKLLSRKSGESPPTSSSGTGEALHPIDQAVQEFKRRQQSAQSSATTRDQQRQDQQSAISTSSGNASEQARKPQDQDQLDSSEFVSQSNSPGRADSLVPSTPPPACKSKVRFSDEPATIFDTHAPSDYDRRNDDIDPVAASAEYEIEKSKEREGIRDSDDDEDDEEHDGDHDNGEGGENAQNKGKNEDSSSHDVEAVIEKFNNQAGNSSCPSSSTTASQLLKTSGDSQGATQTLRSALRTAPGALGGPSHVANDSYGDAKGSSSRKELSANDRDDGDEEDQASARREYIESLEREVSLKRIFEQNLRELQSQYYETVKQLDSYKGSAEAKMVKLEQNLADLNNRYESSQNELADAREQSSGFEKQLNDIRESSQLLEKKYHRAKRIIKDMQSREESFTRREQLYQQKLDEIEYELGVLISTIDKTIYDDGLKYFSLTGPEATNCTRHHQTRLDVFGLIRQMLENFSQSQQPTQSAQIKQRIVSMLEQQLANLLALSNGGTSVVSGPVVPIPPVVPQQASDGSGHNTTTSKNNNKLTSSHDDQITHKQHNQNYSYASHRLSQPNMPHPIGVGGQPTKIFHGLNPMPISASLNEPSPPQSVNSYPSTNSLNSLTNNNNNNNQLTINNNNPSHPTATSKLRDLTAQVAGTRPGGDPSLVAAGLQSSTSDNDNFQAQPTDIQGPFQANEWHDKPVSEWTTNQVSTWLLALGLDQYISKFEDRNVNGQSLINLDSTVLKGLGVLNSNDRNLLKKKIRELRVEMEKERKIIEKKIKENLKEKSKTQVPNQAGQKSWKKSLLS